MSTAVTPVRWSCMVDEVAEAAAFGPNAWLVDDMYERYLRDPASVAESWRDFFDGYGADRHLPPLPDDRRTADLAVPVDSAETAEVAEAVSLEPDVPRAGPVDGLELLRGAA